MTQSQYQARQLSPLLEAIQKKGASGTLRINAAIKPNTPYRSRILVWQKGEITYADSTIPNVEILAQRLVKQFKVNFAETGIKFALEKVSNRGSAREILSLLCKIKVLTWMQIESTLQTQAAITLEQILPYGGQFEFSPTVEFDLTYGEDCHGLNWSKLQLELANRTQLWATLAPTIPSMEAIPHLPKAALDAISIEKVRLHAMKWIDGKNSIIEIAEQIVQDPVKLAQLYLSWAQNNWIVFPGAVKTAENKDLPIVLSVDDSPIVQTKIKRALEDRYNVILANSAVDALNILNAKRVSILLLDVTMPDIDGLEMCRTVRSIPRFYDLPVIMLTAKDSLVDKMKGQIAGTNRYLTKPFDREKLLETIAELLQLS